MALPETDPQSVSKDKTPKVCAIVVSYFPAVATLQRLVTATLPQVNALVLVDNGTSDPVFEDYSSKIGKDGIVVLKQRGNTGLAAAFNRGIAWAREQGFSHVLLLDQDSEPAPGMVRALLNALAAPYGKGKIAAVGPRFHDAREGQYAPFVRIGFPFNRKIVCKESEGLIDTDFLISSGSLIPISVFDDVGGMEEGLFIDNVDLEWCFRARHKGYALIGVCSATMHHRLGHGRRQMPAGLRSIVVHDPIRLYYIMRNRVLLYHLPHTPAVWIAQDVLRVPFKFFLFSVLIPPRLKNIRFMLSGLRDGLSGRTGPI
jgi:rhamnosyltransferase